MFPVYIYIRLQALFLKIRSSSYPNPAPIALLLLLSCSFYPRSWPTQLHIQIHSAVPVDILPTLVFVSTRHYWLYCTLSSLTPVIQDIRNAADAQVVFEAVRLNILPMIRRRLGPTERDMLRSGEIFVWEETDQKGGLERWTDGRRWCVRVCSYLHALPNYLAHRSQSRMRVCGCAPFRCLHHLNGCVCLGTLFILRRERTYH